MTTHICSQGKWWRNGPEVRRRASHNLAASGLSEHGFGRASVPPAPRDAAEHSAAGQGPGRVGQPAPPRPVQDLVMRRHHVKEVRSHNDAGGFGEADDGRQRSYPTIAEQLFATRPGKLPPRSRRDLKLPNCGPKVAQQLLREPTFSRTSEDPSRIEPCVSHLWPIRANIGENQTKFDQLWPMWAISVECGQRRLNLADLGPVHPDCATLGTQMANVGQRWLKWVRCWPELAKMGQ